jgi:hypothetical protein
MFYKKNSRLALIDAFVGITEAIDIDADLALFVESNATTSASTAGSAPILPEFVDLDSSVSAAAASSSSSAAQSSSSTTTGNATSPRSIASSSSLQTSTSSSTLASNSSSPSSSSNNNNNNNADDTEGSLSRGGRLRGTMASRVSRAKAAAKRVANKHLPSQDTSSNNNSNNNNSDEPGVDAVYGVPLARLLQSATTREPGERSLASRLQLPW